MTKLTSFVLCFITFGFAKGQQVLTLEGRYTGENLYFQNPFIPADAFCTDSILVNGKRVMTELNSTAFEVKLTESGLKPYDSLMVKVYHKTGCAPKVLPAFVHHRSYVRVSAISFDSSGVLNWTLDNDSLLNRVVFIVEQYKWNKWVKAGEVEQSDARQTQFSFKPVLHTGENRFRVKYADHSGKPCLSGSAQMTSAKPQVTFKTIRSQRKVIFSSKTQYELYDSSGNMINRGYESEVLFPKNTRAVYFLNYDNRTEEIRFN